MDKTPIPPDFADTKWWAIWLGCSIIGPLSLVLRARETRLGIEWLAACMIILAIGMATASVKLTREKNEGLGCFLMAGGLLLMGSIFFYGCMARLRF